MKIVSATQMAKLDSEAIKTHGIPGEELMERAGKGIFKYVTETIQEHNLTPYVVLYAGKGNNGGDAFVVARYLEQAGIRNTTVVLTDEASLKGDAKLNYSQLKNSGAEIEFALTPEELRKLSPQYTDCGLIVDGILGTGIKGEAAGFFAEAIEFINSQEKRVVAIDVPSGINGDDGHTGGPCIDAYGTVTMGLPKQGLFLGGSLDFIGRLRTVDIGIPDEAIAKAESPAELVTKDDVKQLLPRRRRISHKGDYGRVMALCGSRGYTGAGYLVTQAAMRCGTGLAYLLIPESLNAAMESKLTEVITVPVPETDTGTPSYAALDIVIEKLARCDAAAVGPGLSTNPETARLVRGIMRKASAPLVLDADGINCIKGEKELLRNYAGPCIITPHVGELSRLMGTSKEEIVGDLWGAAGKSAKELGVVLVLKSAQTVIATPEGEIHVNIAGNAGMASAGVGDVLTGVIVSLLGQGLETIDAARLGVFLHGTAGDIAADAIPLPSLIATDLLETLPLAIGPLDQRH